MLKLGGIGIAVSLLTAILARAQDSARVIVQPCAESKKHVTVWNNSPATCIIHVHCDFMDCQGRLGYAKVACYRLQADGPRVLFHTALTNFAVKDPNEKWKIYLTMPLMQGADIEYRLDTGTMDDELLPTELMACAWKTQDGKTKSIDTTLRKYSIEQRDGGFRI